MNPDLVTVLEYHQASKHDFGRYARGPGRLDWATQPEPFRRYGGAPLIALDHPSDADSPAYGAVLDLDRVPAQPLSHHTISALFYDSLALSAWKQAGGTRWALRVNPSSGNLHPTEAYLLCGAVDGLAESPIVAHYAPRAHAIEVRAEVPTVIGKRSWQPFRSTQP